VLEDIDIKESVESPQWVQFSESASKDLTRLFDGMALQGDLDLIKKPAVGLQTKP